MKKHRICTSNILFFTLLCIFLLPFIRNILTDIGNSALPPFYNFGLNDPKDFYTFWIALFGAIGIAYNIYQNQKRISNQQKQINIQVKEQRDNSFSKGVEMLGHGSESSRIGGVYSLFFLAGEFPGEYAETVFEILCAHIRSTTSKESYQQEFGHKPSNEIQTILNLLFKDQKRLSFFKNYKANLRKSWLAGVNLSGAGLSNAYLSGVNLSGAYMPKANLAGANLAYANLVKVDLTASKMSEAYMPAVDLSGAQLTKCDLSGSYLAQAHIRETNLSGAFLPEAYLGDVYIMASDLSGANLANADLTTGEFHKTNLKGAILTYTDLSKVVIEDTDLSEAIVDFSMLPKPCSFSHPENMAVS